MKKNLFPALKLISYLILLLGEELELKKNT